MNLNMLSSRHLIGKHYTLTDYNKDGVTTTSPTHHEDHCYYHGHIEDVEDSSVSLSLCSGMRGFLRVEEKVFLIEPLEVTGIEEEGLVAVYRQEHLRRKRSSCSSGNDTVYDHGPSGLFQHSSLVYRPLGIRVMLVGLELWSYRDQIIVRDSPDDTLTSFLQWRQDNLLRRTAHDNAQLVTAVDFVGTTVGLATSSAMCTPKSGGVNQDHSAHPLGVASTIAHEMGHNLGMAHDDASLCSCSTRASARSCVMAESIGRLYPSMFSSCSVEQLSRFLEDVNPSCLLDTPLVDRIYGGPHCGNAFLEPGEECDCGTVEECSNPCCNASTCRLNMGAQCAQGDCCHNCQLRQVGAVCRPSTGDCDLTEHCSGLSPACPPDAHTLNGQPCDNGEGYCYNGQCPSHRQHCKRLWGPGKTNKRQHTHTHTPRY
uniref:ADAM metallopeptidase domain 8b n=1 Tax=Esox lucius TaxID=8010 RepID=A0A6Q2ZL66_ESOLU